jgi:translation initiation factor 2 subunit beta (aeIF-2b)
MNDAMYESLLNRLYSKIQSVTSKDAFRLELPQPDVIWSGNRTVLRNFSDYPKLLRRDPEKLLLFLAKELGSSANIVNERAFFIGKWEQDIFKTLLQRYLKEYVLCPICGSPDTKVEKVKRLTFLVCEACGARSSLKGKFV